MRRADAGLAGAHAVSARPLPDARPTASEALELAVAAGDRARPRSDVLNTLGMTKARARQLDEGVALLRRAIEMAREVEDLDGLADRVRQPRRHARAGGRTREALEVAHEGLAATAAAARAQPATG